MADITIAIAALAGLGSFVAPCILPMIPAFLAYISGTTITELHQKGNATLSINRTNIILNTVFFVLGFSVVFSAIGVLINSVLSSSATELVTILNQIGGIIIIGFGGFLLLSTKFVSLNVEKRFFPKKTKSSYPLSFLFGLAFAAGAMLYVVFQEIIPECHRRGFQRETTFSTLLGIIFMVSLAYSVSL